MFFYHPQLMRVFLHFNNLLDNKWLNFKIPSWNICTIIPFRTCSLTRYLKPIMPKFYHVLAQGQTLSLQFDQFSQPFDYLLQFFPQHFGHDLDYPIPQLQASFYVCAHIPSTLWISTFYVMFMAANTLNP